jgi:hypothetical protein
MTATENVLENMVYVNPSELVTRQPFCTLFRVRADVKERVLASMQEDGFDASKPINVWRQKNVVVDGHTRRECAIEAGIEVLVHLHDFKDEDEAMDYAIANQRDRRNLTDAELAALVIVVDERKPRGGDHKSEEAKSKRSSDPIDSKPSREKTAALTGTSETKVKKIRAIVDHAEKTGDTEEKEAVLNGEMSINLAERLVKRKKVKRKKAKRKTGTTGTRLPDTPAPPPAKSKYQMPTLNPERSADDVAFLESIRLCRKVRSRIIEEDAIAFHRLESLLDEMRAKLATFARPQSNHLMGPLRKMLRQVLSVPSPDLWSLCTKCDGQGCPKCKDHGYTIPQS